MPEDSGVEKSEYYLWGTRKLRRDGDIHYPDYGDNPAVQPTVNFTSIVLLKTCVWGGGGGWGDAGKEMEKIGQK